MGLTIHWHQKENTIVDEKTALACVDFVRDVAQKSGWEILDDWDREVEAGEYQKDFDGEQILGKVRTVGICVHPHKDCESILISFDVTNGIMRNYADYGHTKYQYASQFCKTHYAGFEVHKKVCKFLNAIDKHFVRLEVSDEGDYYGIWDDEKGKKVFGEYVAFVHGMTGQLKEAFGAENSIASEDTTDGWKEDYIDHLAREHKKDV